MTDTDMATPAQLDTLESAVDVTKLDTATKNITSRCILQKTMSHALLDLFCP